LTAIPYRGSPRGRVKCRIKRRVKREAANFWRHGNNLSPHPEERGTRVSKDVATSRASWFETALTHLLTMRGLKRLAKLALQGVVSARSIFTHDERKILR
jgi:hypothetical protein